MKKILIAAVAAGAGVVLAVGVATRPRAGLPEEECPPTTTDTTTTPTETTPTETTPTETTPTTPPGTPTPVPQPGIGAPPGAGTGDNPNEQKVTKFGAATPETSASGSGAESLDELPFTGANLGLLMVVGLVLAGVGIVGVRAVAKD